jgi:phosphoribosylformimino-5-aminoimidazole carboxamide ribotide isomerase
VLDLLPAIDLREGRVVRLTRGDDGRRTEYDVSPHEMLERYAEAGVERVHVVDLDAAMGEAPQRRLLAELAGGPGPKIQLGGGLRDRDSVRWAIETGAERLVIGSMVAQDPDLFVSLVEELPGRLLPALDIKQGKIQVDGWRAPAERSMLGSCSVLRGLDCPAMLVTDIARDGTLQGPNLGLARELADRAGIPALLSGGVRSLADLAAAREGPQIVGAVVGKAIYEGRFTVREALAVCRGDEIPTGSPA